MTYEAMYQRLYDLRMKDMEFQKMKAKHELEQKIFAFRIAQAMNAPIIATAELIRGSMSA